MDAPCAALPPIRARAVVVGASSGIGAALVRELVGRGFQVAALARRAQELDALARELGPERVLAKVHDVRRREEVPALFEELVRRLGGLDWLVYASGIMPKVGPSEFDTEIDAEILSVNTLGAISWCNPAAEYFLAQRRGVIVGIGSIAGDRGRRGNPVYGASKAALIHYLEALRNRLSDYGVRVCTIQPGRVATVMTEGLRERGVAPEAAARTIVSYAAWGCSTRYVPLRWHAISLVLRAIPSFLFRRLTI
jgi:NAD(P)-dependent dehydrogenase (short-subunit alcohol dehydrogenase family)